MPISQEEFDGAKSTFSNAVQGIEDKVVASSAPTDISAEIQAAKDAFNFLAGAAETTDDEQAEQDTQG